MSTFQQARLSLCFAQSMQLDACNKHDGEKLGLENVIPFVLAVDVGILRILKSLTEDEKKKTMAMIRAAMMMEL